MSISTLKNELFWDFIGGKITIEELQAEMEMLDNMGQNTFLGLKEGNA